MAYLVRFTCPLAPPDLTLKGSEQLAYLLLLLSELIPFSMEPEVHYALISFEGPDIWLPSPDLMKKGNH